MHFIFTVRRELIRSVAYSKPKALLSCHEEAGTEEATESYTEAEEQFPVALLRYFYVTEVVGLKKLRSSYSE